MFKMKIKNEEENVHFVIKVALPCCCQAITEYPSIALLHSDIWCPLFDQFVK